MNLNFREFYFIEFIFFRIKFDFFKTNLIKFEYFKILVNRIWFFRI